MIEHCLRSLLGDENVPETIVSSAINELLEDYKTSHDESLIDIAWTYFAGHLTESQLCVGPPIGKGVLKRVARVLSLDSFLMHSGAHAFFDIAQLSSELKARRKHHDQLKHSDLSRHLLKHFFSQPRFGRSTWVTDAEYISDVSASDLSDELGLLHLNRGTELVAIEYAVSSEELKIPTVFDAYLYPGFVSKPKHSHSRAWNWRDSQWGMDEYVHLPSVVAREARIRYLGVVEDDPPKNAGEVDEIKFNSSKQINQLLEGVLGQLVAHVELAPFLSGEKDILTLSPKDFERFVSALYSRQGYLTTLTQMSRDGGFDVIATLNPSSGDGVLIQAKKYVGSVGISVVRELIGARYLAGSDYQNYKLAIVTSGRISRDARKAELQHPIEINLRDYKDIADTLRHFSNARFKDILPTQIYQTLGLY